MNWRWARCWGRTGQTTNKNNSSITKSLNTFYVLTPRRHTFSQGSPSFHDKFLKQFLRLSLSLKVVVIVHHSIGVPHSLHHSLNYRSDMPTIIKPFPYLTPHAEFVLFVFNLCLFNPPSYFDSLFVAIRKSLDIFCFKLWALLSLMTADSSLSDNTLMHSFPVFCCLNRFLVRLLSQQS